MIYFISWKNIGIEFSDTFKVVHFEVGNLLKDFEKVILDKYKHYNIKITNISKL